MRPVLIRDIETRSLVDVGDVGAHVYARHPSTTVLCVGYCLDSGPIKIWRPGQPVPKEFSYALRHKKYGFGAHGAAFELEIERNILVPKYGFPALPLERNICTMAISHALSLPGALEKIAKVLNLDHMKDSVGHKVMLQMSKPRRAKKAEDQKQTHWYNDAERMGKLEAYCMDDVAATREILDTLPELSEQEYQVWLLDQKINNHGIYLDRKLLLAAKQIIEAALPSFDQEMAELTGGQVMAITEVAKLKTWINQFYPIDTIRKGDLEELLQGELPDNVRQALELRQQGAHAAVKKVYSLLNRREADGRVRGAFIYHAAGTGRWCVDADTLIETPTWPRRIIDLSPGDLIIGGSGQPRKVLAKLYKGREPMYRLSGPDAFVVATAGHRVMTEQGWKRIDDCFQEMVGESFVLRRGCTPISYTPPYNGRDRCQARLQLANLEQGIGADDTPGRIQAAETSSVFSRQDWAQESNVRGEDSGRAYHAARLSRRVERQRLHPGTSSHFNEGVGSLSLAEGLGGAPHRWGQDQQHAGQFDVSNKTRASKPAQVEAWSLVSVGERDVWDITVEGDASYIAQGLAHHNSSRGAQVHNLKRPLTEDIEAAIKIVSTGDYAQVRKAYPNPLSVIGDLIRATIAASAGSVLMGADFSGIEARVTAWSAGEESKLDAFRAYDAGKGPDPYIIAAGIVLNLDPLDIARRFKAGDPIAREQRQIGKACELAFGYQGGVNAFRRFMPSGGLALTSSQTQWEQGSRSGGGPRGLSGDQKRNQIETDDFTDAQIDRIKNAWRRAHPHIAQFWTALANAAWRVTHDHSKIVTVLDRLTFECDDQPIMWITLPSGRKLSYPHARVGNFYKHPSGAVTESLKMNMWANSSAVGFKDASAGQWRDVLIYGGYACENVVQAISRDLLSEAMLRVDKAGFAIVAHVHDECVIEVPKKDAPRILPEFKRLMNVVPKWAAGLPIVAKPWQATRYVK